jgi:hypothetical protein
MPTAKPPTVAGAEPNCPSEAGGLIAKLLQRDSPWKVSKESVQEFVATLAAAGFVIVKADNLSKAARSDQLGASGGE